MADGIDIKVTGVKEVIGNLKKYQVIKTGAVKIALKETGFKIEGDAKKTCLHPRTKILTKNGWIYLKDIKEGDLVTTQSGEFKAVEKIVKDKPSKFVRIFIHSGAKINKIKGRFDSIVGDPEHLIKTTTGWKSFGDLQIGDEIYMLASKCKECESLCHFGLSFCSKKCKGKWDYKFKDSKQSLSIGHIKAREFAQKRDNENIAKKFKEWKERNPEKVLAYRKKQGASLARFYKKNPDKHPNAICAKNNKFSGLEKTIIKLLKQSKINFMHQFKVGKYWIDFALPDMGILLECDGSYWHQDKKREKRRDDEIKKIIPNWQLIHLSEDEINNLSPRGLSQYLYSNLGDIKFTKIKIANLKEIPPPKSSPQFIDLIIDNGQGTFIANGFLVHNCPVDTGRLRASLSTNWSGSPLAQGGTGPKAMGDDGVSRPIGPPGLVVVVGSNVKYAAAVEFGGIRALKWGGYRAATSKLYLSKAYHKNQPELVMRLGKIFKT